MKCSQAATLFSPYLDGAVTGKEMHKINRHLEGCGACRQEYAALQRTQHLLATVGRRKAPADLSLKLRLAISQEVRRAHHPYWGAMRQRMQNILEAFMVPATAGLTVAVLIFGMFMGFSALPLQAGNPDVPLIIYTAPQLQQTAFGTSLTSINEDSLVIEAYVGSNGRVQDYRVLSDRRESKDLSPQVKSMLIDFMTFTTFRPATSMGRPTSGKAVLSFSNISVKG
jgi:Putative zinc-finger